ncbi:hypothetical protein Hdeb2414_s0003g00101711 [Helianthus debilis subsp. tardiflorus]
MIGGSILVTSRLQAVVLRVVDFGGVTNPFQASLIFFNIIFLNPTKWLGKLRVSMELILKIRNIPERYLKSDYNV